MRRKKLREKKELAIEDLLLIKEKTKLPRRHIQTCYKNFITKYPEGHLEKNDVVKDFRKVVPLQYSETFAHHIFEQFGSNSTDSLSFTDLILATHKFETSKPREILRWVFRLLDKTNSGSIELEELVEMFGCLFAHEGLDTRKAVKRATRIFDALDSNNDLSITEEEFVNGCMKEKSK